MFTWICPQCGHEVPPSYSECPNCAENRQRAAQAIPPAGSQPVAPGPAAPPPYQPGYPQQPAYPPQQPYPPQPLYPPQQPTQPQYAPPPPQWQTAPMPPQQSYTLPDASPRKGLPAWLVTILVAVVAVGVIFGIYKLLGSKSGSGADSTTAALQQSAAAGDSANPYAKYVEITGVRIVEDEKKHPIAHFLVVNHSAADLPELELEVALTTTTSKAGDDPLAVINVKTGSIPANGSKDVAAPLNSKLRAYELPDWQFLKASFAVKPPR